jgi:hypothetical protein
LVLSCKTAAASSVLNVLIFHARPESKPGSWYLVLSRKSATASLKKCVDLRHKAKYQVANTSFMGEPGLRGKPAASGAENL